MSRVDVSLESGSGYPREPYQHAGQATTVQWLKGGATFLLDNYGPPDTYSVRLSLAATAPRPLRLRLGEATLLERQVSKVLWVDGTATIEAEVPLASGPNELRVESDRAPDRLPDGRDVTFILVGDVGVTRKAAAPVESYDLSWLDRVPADGEGFLLLSEGRAYTYDESAYDAQYDDKPDLGRGRGVVRLLEELGAPFGGPALEVGCGTGTLSLGLAAASPYPCLLLTDASDAFLKLTREKLRRAGVGLDGVRFGVLLGEEIGRLPEGALSLVILRSALHHVVDVRAFVKAAAKTLGPGGVLTFEEPCAEGYVLMGALSRLLPDAARAHGRPLTPEQEAAVDLFARTMLFYARKDMDKAESEDKHVFRFHELHRMAGEAGLDVRFLPNVTYEECEHGIPGPSHATSFRQFFRNYLEFCMTWDQELLSLFDLALSPRLDDLELLAGQGAGPAMHGIFVCRKGTIPA